MIAHPAWAYENLIIAGHLIVIVAEPNGGKTTIMLNSVAPELVKAGFRVFYVNADVSGSDAKEMVEVAQEAGFTLMLPDMTGGSMQQIVDKLAEMAEARDDYSGTVFVFDTLKNVAKQILVELRKK